VTALKQAGKRCRL